MFTTPRIASKIETGDWEPRVTATYHMGHMRQRRGPETEYRFQAVSRVSRKSNSDCLVFIVPIAPIFVLELQIGAEMPKQILKRIDEFGPR